MPECCVPCPAAQASPPAAGITSGSKAVKKDKPCPCRKCCCGKPRIVKPCYKQPPIPESFAPQRCYVKPAAKVESGTTYKMSYLPVDCKNLRGEMYKPEPNIVVSCEPMQGNTVQKLSYLPNPVCPIEAIRPCHHDMWGKGPMQNITTQRHDYVPKPSTVRENFKPQPTLPCAEAPFENRTVNKLSYLPPDEILPTKSFAPIRCYEKPVAKMDVATTHKMSYMPNQIQPRTPVPWNVRPQYEKPCQKLDANTTYTMSYLGANEDCRRRPILPNVGSNPVTVSTAFESGTVYRNSYLPAKTPVPPPVKPQPNIMTSTAQMDCDTVQKLSYLPNPVCPIETMRPCHHDMWGKGPMQNMTTQRHDYVPKSSVPRENFKPQADYKCVDQPFEGRTVNRLSYLDPGRVPRPLNFAPLRCYEKPASKMDCATTQKLSYQPTCVPRPERPKRDDGYKAPCTKIEATTVYKSSFLPPGEDCTEYIDPCEYGECQPCTCTCPAECIESDPCACEFPKAACCA